MNFIKALFYLAFCLVFAFSAAQELPPIHNFSTEAYKGGNQNWSITQVANRHIFVANNAGLLEFNGSKWNLYTSPNQTVIRSVKSIEDRIYTGCYMEFGYWERDNYGILNYHSLSKKLETKLIEDEQFWNIIGIDHYVLFQSFQRIYIYNSREKTFKIISPKNAVIKMFKLNETIYFQEKGNGLQKVVNGDSVTVINNESINNLNVINMFNHYGDILLQTEVNGFYFLKDDELQPWLVEASSQLKNFNIYSSTQLKDGSFVLGTISNGIIHIDPDGRYLTNINQDKGLNNNTILSIFEDADQNIWLGQDNGISYLNFNAPFRIYNDDKGHLGTVYTSLEFDNILYLGTNQGLFLAEVGTGDDFEIMEGTEGQVWSLRLMDGKIFCGHNKGTIIIEYHNISKIIDEAEGSWDFKFVPDSPDLILQGNFNGLHILEKRDGQWNYRNKIEGIDISSRFFDFYRGQIFVNHELKGIYVLDADADYRKVVKKKVISHIDKGIGSNIFVFNGQLLYSSSEGIFDYVADGTFKKDSIWSAIFTPYHNLTTLMKIKGEPNILWRYADDDIVFLSSGSVSEKPSFKKFPIASSVKNVVTGFENISEIRPNTYLVGRSDGYLIIDTKSDSDEEDITISFNSIVANKIDNPIQRIQIQSDTLLPNKMNNIRFNYSIAYYDKIIRNKYQYQLQGISDKWSNWTENSSQEFKNLPFGSYTFRVRGRHGNHISNNMASYSFKIDRPWYLSNLAIILYTLGGIGLVMLMHYYYRRYYKRQQLKVVEKAKRDLELKEMESQQQLMRLRNESLRQDIENKNRELAISTMSLIKKNEFLNTIKKELKAKEKTTNVKRVIRIIDQNLNNTDDWEFFEQAFNNADKEFLHKIKAEHPTLTPNDLKLCAYLRLNLSSKEIAPLLNISPRSVEVKRYRLRKKMQLEHETSLTNYILEL